MPKQPVKEAVPAISVDHVSIAYGAHAVLDDISFEIPQGTVTAVIGPNGSGKSTLMKAILGLVPTSYGEIRLFGKHFHAMRHLVGYVPQNFDFTRDFPLTVREFLELALHPHSPLARIEEKIRAVGLSPVVLDQNIGTLSGGQLQRVLIAQAILNNPTILFLDEPATGIDIVGEAAFYDIIRTLNETTDTTILLVSHDIAVVSSVVDMVVCINKKLMCSGPPGLALSDKTLAELFGHKAGLYRHEPHGKHADHDHAH
jgi:ABC-type Mn2+/Zn2+ transport system ATPase subunit